MNMNYWSDKTFLDIFINIYRDWIERKEERESDRDFGESCDTVKKRTMQYFNRSRMYFGIKAIKTRLLLLTKIGNAHAKQYGFVV